MPPMGSDILEGEGGAGAEMAVDNTKWWAWHHRTKMYDCGIALGPLCRLWYFLYRYQIGTFSYSGACI